MKQFPKLNILNHNFPRYETGEKTKTFIVSFFHYQHQHHRNRNRNIQSCVGWPEAADLSDLNESWCKLSEPLWPALGQSGKIAQLIKISISTFPLWVLRCQLDWVRDMGGSGQVRGDNVTTQAGKVSLSSHVASPLCTLPWLPGRIQISWVTLLPGEQADSSGCPCRKPDIGCHGPPLAPVSWSWWGKTVLEIE